MNTLPVNSAQSTKEEIAEKTQSIQKNEKNGTYFFYVFIMNKVKKNGIMNSSSISVFIHLYSKIAIAAKFIE